MTPIPRPLTSPHLTPSSTCIYICIYIYLYSSPLCTAVTRDRMGRLLTFVARIVADQGAGTAVHGLGVDEHTALLLDASSGAARAVGVNTAYVCTPSHAPEVCVAGKPLTFKSEYYPSATRPLLLNCASVCVLATLQWRLSPYSKLPPVPLVDIHCVRLSGSSGDEYSFDTFQPLVGGVAYTNNITAGHYGDFPYGPGPTPIPDRA